VTLPSEASVETLWGGRVREWDVKFFSWDGGEGRGSSGVHSGLCDVEIRLNLE